MTTQPGTGEQREAIGSPPHARRDMRLTAATFGGILGALATNEGSTAHTICMAVTGVAGVWLLGDALRDSRQVDNYDHDDSGGQGQPTAFDKMTEVERMQSLIDAVMTGGYGGRMMP